jgi:hypothetical protein
MMALEPGPGDRILAEKRAAKDRRNSIAAGAAAGAILFGMASVLIIYTTVNDESDEQILDHIADCTLAKGYLVMRALGAKNPEIIRNLKSSSITKYQRMAEEYQLEHPDDSKRNYLKAVESVACEEPHEER